MNQDDLPAAHRIPQEIMDHIMGQVSSEKEALSTFALVSSSCLRAARPYLFADVILYQNPHTKLGRMSRASVAQLHRRLDTGLEIIAASPMIASSIRTVHFRGTREDLPNTIVKAFDFMSYLPNLRGFSSNGVSWRNFELKYLPAVLKGLAAIAPKLKDLSLVNWSFANSAEFLAFILAFRNLRGLSLDSVDWVDISAGRDLSADSVFRRLPGLPCAQKPCLERLAVECTPFQDVMEMLLKGDLFNLDLKAMSVPWNEDLEVPKEFSVYEKFFNIVGRTLRFLKLKVNVGIDHDSASAITQLLAKCCCLRTISIDVYDSWVEVPCVWFRPIVETLAAASPSHLEEFTIVCKLGSTNRYIPWDLLDSTLSDTHCFPNFKKLHIIIDLSEDGNCVEAAYTALDGLMRHA